VFVTPAHRLAFVFVTPAHRLAFSFVTPAHPAGVFVCDASPPGWRFRLGHGGRSRGPEEERAMRRPDLISDCARCAALCCVAPSFDASDDFAIDKPAGIACGYVTRDCRCAIHDELAARGFAGCTLYDCYGAGPRVTRAFSDGDARNEAFLLVRVVHELL
jgi:hypothetical protein